MGRTVKTDSRAGGRPEGGDVDCPTLYRLLTANSRELVSRHSPELTFLYASPAAQLVLGHSPEQLLGHRLDDFTHHDDLASLVTTFAIATEPGETSETTFRCRTGDGKWRWCEIFCHGVRGEEHGSTEIHATIRDITRYKQIEKAMERVAREWRSTFDAAHDAILMLDSNANILRVNLATLELLNCEFRDLIGSSAETVFRERLGLDTGHLNIQAVIKKRCAHHADVPLPGHDRWLRARIDPVLLSEKELEGMVIFLSDITAEKRSEEKLLETLQKVRELSRHLEGARESERRSIAREVHDELGHALTAIKMDTAWLLKRLSSDSGELKQRGDELLTRIDQTIETTRRIVTDLRPPVLDDLGLDAALDWLISDFGKYADIDVEVDLAQAPKRLRGKQSITIFRIVQEALTNIRRHADASRLKLDWEQTDGWHVLTILDNGRGFDPGMIAGQACFGLLGMEERAHSLNGTLTIDSGPGNGTSLTIKIPDDQLK